jgi:hypothetical protein
VPARDGIGVPGETNAVRKGETEAGGVDDFFVASTLTVHRRKTLPKDLNTSTC